MAIQITNTTLLSVFDLVKSAILNNTTLKQKFNTRNIFQYEPKHKSLTFKGFPYFLINIPDTDTTKEVFDNNFTMKELTANAVLRVDYMARDKVLDYANAFIKAIEAYESTFESSGYYEIKVDLVDVDPNIVIESKEVVEATFELTWRGSMTR